METKCHTGKDADLLESCARIMTDVSATSTTIVIIVNILIHFPEIMKKIGFWPEGAVKIRSMTKQIMKERDEKDIKVGDFVDRLRDYKKVAKAPITGEMIEAQGMIFLLAGFETTASTLGKAIYL